MAGNWQDDRVARLHELGVAGSAVAEEESESGGFVYVADELILTANAVTCLPSLVAPDYVDLSDDHPWTGDLHLRVFRYSGPDPLPPLADQLRDQAREAAPSHGLAPSSCDVALNHVFSGEHYIYHGGPAGPPELPAAAWGQATTPTSWGTGAPFVVVLDTGLVLETPLALAAKVAHDAADEDPGHEPGVPGTDLGTEAAHGTFIASVIERMAGGGVAQRAVKVLNPDGFGTETDIVAGLVQVLDNVRGVGILNLSLGAYTYRDRPPLALRTAISAFPRDVVVVAAAGNNGVANRPFWPAGMARVVGVASVRDGDFGPEPSEFSNSGAWVDVCTQGERVLGAYAFGTFPDPSTPAPFEGWAQWSGTSFAAPIVVAEIARRALASPPMTAADAWRELRSDLAPASDGNPDLELFGLLWPAQQTGIDPSQP